MTEDTKHALSVNHFAQDADWTEWLDATLFTVNASENPQTRVANQSALKMNVRSKSTSLDRAACLNNHVAH